MVETGGARGSDPPVIEVRGLRMRYGTVDVLDGVDLHARRGEVLVLLGPNGAGKTTTVEILEGFRRRSAGEVRVLGVDPERADEDWRARVGVVLQSWRDHPRWRVRELLVHLARYYRPFDTAQRRRPVPADELLELVGLRQQAQARIATLSGGQRRRLDVAIGLIGRPELLFLDEPSAGFDPQARQEFHDLVHRLSDREETTVVLTTHDLDEADKLADRILVMVAGRIVADGSAVELARDLVGGSEVRYRLDGTPVVHACDDATAYVRELFAQHGTAVSELEVRRRGLEDAYLELVRSAGSGPAPARLTAVGS
jgi:ABC-2 type transport system ATP-binding protein